MQNLVVVDPLAKLIDGTLTGWSLGQKIKQAARDEELYQRQLERDNEAKILRDMETKAMLAQNARPVNGGAVTLSDVSADYRKALNGLPEGLIPNQPDFIRKADPTRTVKYGDQQYELLSREEQRMRQLSDNAALADQQIGQKISEAQKMREALGQEVAGLPGRYLPNELATLLPKLADDAFRDIQLRSQEDRAKADRTSREAIARSNQDAANQRAREANETRLKAAGISASRPTAGQSAVQDRFNQRELERKRKELSDIQAKEDEVHAQRLQIGQTLKAGTVSKDDAAKLGAKLNSLGFELQAFQNRKASVVGASLPPKKVKDAIPEGKSATGPDGHTWMKKDGIVYFVN